MDRREFLRYSFVSGALFIVGDLPSWAEALGSTSLRVIDAHAHPDRYIADSRQSEDPTSTLKSIKGLGMAASSFAAVGDLVFLSQGRVPGTEFHSTKTQLEWWMKRIVKKGEVKLVLKASEVPSASGPDSPPGAILAIEGGDSLAGKPERVKDLAPVAPGSGFGYWNLRIGSGIPNKIRGPGLAIIHLSASNPLNSRKAVGSALDTGQLINAGTGVWPVKKWTRPY